MSIETLLIVYIAIGVVTAASIHVRDSFKDCSVFEESWAQACSSSMAIIVGWPFAGSVFLLALVAIAVLRMLNIIKDRVRSAA